MRRSAQARDDARVDRARDARDVDAGGRWNGEVAKLADRGDRRSHQAPRVPRPSGQGAPNVGIGGPPRRRVELRAETHELALPEPGRVGLEALRGERDRERELGA